MKNARPRSHILLIFLSLFYLPGTVIHELSHYLFAKLLFVGTGHFTVIPRFSDSHFILGSVSIEKTDIFRRFIIGIAPLLVGIILTSVLFYVLSFTKLTILGGLLVSYLILCLLNTMWLSKNDLEGAWKIVLILGLALATFFVLH